MYKTKSAELDYLITLINCALKGEKAPSPDDIDIKELLRLADKQQVYSTVLSVLEDTGRMSEEEQQGWNNFKLSELKKTIFANSEREAICADFDREGIDYIFLKGLVLRNYYPKSSMRQMSDNDILYKAERKKDVYKIMKEHGFHLIGDAATSDDFKKDICAIDFHRELFNPRDDYGFDIDLWKRAEKRDGSNEWVINKEDNYIYTLCHMYKHYVTEGCGIRFLCDIYLISQKESYDEAYIKAQLERYSLTEFNASVRGACEVVFGHSEPSDEERIFIDSVLYGTVFGESKGLEEKIEESGGKLKYILRKFFPKKYVIKETYTAVNKYPFLLPYFYFHRLFSRLFFERKKAKKELKNIIKMR